MSNKKQPKTKKNNEKLKNKKKFTLGNENKLVMYQK
jgi:hypothetical protein